MEPIKIAHVTTAASALRYLLLNQLKDLQRLGYEVASISSSGPDADVVEAAGIRHIGVPMTRMITPWADLVALWRLYKVMRQERFTIVHTHTPKAGLLGRLAAFFARAPIIVYTAHGFYFHDHMNWASRRFYIFCEQVAAHCSSAIFSVNEEDRQTAIRERIGTPRKLHHGGESIDVTRFDRRRFPVDVIDAKRAELGLPADVPVVGFVGRLAAKRKGFTTFLAAAKQLAEQVPEVRFLIVGTADTGRPDAIEPTAARDYGIMDACLFLGQRPNEELPLLYSVMDVLVLPSLFEGLPRNVMEASAMGVPAVVSDVKGNREAVEHGRNGLLVPFGDVDALTEALVRILTSPELARAMGEQGRRMAEERFDDRVEFAKTKAVYDRLLRDKGLSV